MMQTPKRKEKKSESLDVRLPYSVKQNFMASARMRGETASEAVRRFIDSYVAETEAEMARSGPTYKEMTMTIVRNPLKTFGMAASAAATAFAFAAMPSAATEPSYYSVVIMGGGDAPSLVERDTDGTFNIVSFDIDGDGKTSDTETKLALDGEIESSYFSLQTNHADGSLSFTSDQVFTVSFDPASFEVLKAASGPNAAGKVIFFTPTDDEMDMDYRNEAEKILQEMRDALAAE